MKNCPICQSLLEKNEFLSSCLRKTCLFYSWDTQPISEILSKFSMGSNKWKRNFNKIIEDHGIKEDGSNYVYTILLDNKVNLRTQEMKGKKVYIGRTGRHPLIRFLQHKLGYKTTKRSNVKERGVGLIEISNPLSSSDEGIAEEKRYSEYRHAMGWEVYGDGLSQELQKERDRVF